MRILLVGTKHFAELRGAAVAYYGLARALRDRGHELTFLQSARPEDRRELEGVHHVYYDVPRKSLYPLVFALRSLRSYDVIHAMDESGAYLALRHRLEGLPLAVQFQPARVPSVGFRKAHWRWRYNAIAARYAPRFLAPSQWIADAMIARFGIDPSRFRAIPYGIGAAWFAARRPPVASTTGPARIALVNMVGVEIALRAFSKATSGGEATLELYGIDKSPAKHQALVRELGIGDRVHFNGFVPNAELAGRLAGADLWIHPTQHEGFGQVLGEAAALGVPAISSLVDAVPEVVVDGETGWLCPPQDVDAFAEALATGIRNPALRARMGEAAHVRAKRLWRWEIVASRIEDEIYRPLLERA